MTASLPLASFAYPIAIAVGVLVVIGVIVLIVWLNTDPWEDVE